MKMAAMENRMMRAHLLQTVDELTFDLNAPASEEIVHDWGEVARGGRVPHSDETSHRLAVCNMDWDRVSANDIFG